MNVLIMACGKTKRDTANGPLRAIDLYAGRQFGLARRLEALGWRVLILSAKHGLVPADLPLETYDVEMTPQLSGEAVAEIREGRGTTTAAFELATAGAARCLFFGGEQYLRVWEALLAAHGTSKLSRLPRCECEHITGGAIGVHYSILAGLVAEEEIAALPLAA